MALRVRPPVMEPGATSQNPRALLRLTWCIPGLFVVCRRFFKLPPVLRSTREANATEASCDLREGLSDAIRAISIDDVCCTNTNRSAARKSTTERRIISASRVASSSTIAAPSDTATGSRCRSNGSRCGSQPRKTGDSICSRNVVKFSQCVSAKSSQCWKPCGARTGVTKHIDTTTGI